MPTHFIVDPGLHLIQWKLRMENCLTKRMMPSICESAMKYWWVFFLQIMTQLLNVPSIFCLYHRLDHRTLKECMKSNESPFHGPFHCPQLRMGDEERSVCKEALKKK